MNPANAAPLGLALLGLLMGMRHATDPDHVVAVTAILSRERRFAAATRVGLIWGIGHTVTVLAVGAAIIIFKVAIPTRVGLGMEFAVAVVLILLGLGAAARVGRRLAARVLRLGPAAEPSLIVHSHPHRHGRVFHRHSHVHAHLTSHAEYWMAEVESLEHEHLSGAAALPWPAQRPLLRSFGVGLVHGLAGSAAIALLVLSAIPQPLWASIYLAIFCVGVIIGMGLITTAIATPFVIARRAAWLHQGLVTGSGLLSFCFGLFLAYQLGIVDHLFGSMPIWSPH